MDQFILRYHGKEAAPPEDIAQVQAANGVTVLDVSGPRMLYVAGPADALEALVIRMPEWTLIPETFYALPDPQPKVERTPRPLTRLLRSSDGQVAKPETPLRSPAVAPKPETKHVNQSSCT